MSFITVLLPPASVIEMTVYCFIWRYVGRHNCIKLFDAPLFSFYPKFKINLEKQVKTEFGMLIL